VNGKGVGRADYGLWVDNCCGCCFRLGLGFLFVIHDLVIILLLDSVFGDGTCFFEAGVVVGDGFRAPRTLDTRSVPSRSTPLLGTSRLAWSLQSVWAWHPHALRASVRKSPTSASTMAPSYKRVPPVSLVWTTSSYPSRTQRITTRRRARKWICDQ
jgi:hypothetical protein